MTTCEDRIAKKDGELANQCESPSSQKGFCCEIRVKGYLNSSWSDWFEGMEVNCIDNGETLLCGFIVDQAALMGILNKLNRLNLPLISVNEVKQGNDE